MVLVDFWTDSCINCQRAIPHVNAWYERYRDIGEGFEVIGVHTPSSRSSARPVTSSRAPKTSA